MAWPSSAPRTWVDGERETAAIFNAEVRDAGQSGPMATTVTGLAALFSGTPGAGARGYIKYGSSPFDYVALVYDTATTKWAEQDADLVVQAVATVTGAGTGYSVAVQGPLMDHKLLADAGLKLYIRVKAYANAGASSSMFVNCLVSTGAAGGALTSDVTNVTSEVSTASATDVLLDSGWNILNGSVSVAGLITLNIGMKRTGATSGNIRAGTAIWCRWGT